MTNHLGLLLALSLISIRISAQQPVEVLVERGRGIFHASPVGCWVCHGEDAQGLVGPTLHFGPTPVDIFDQLESNPMMAVIVTELNLNDEDLMSLSMYIRSLAGLPLDDRLPAQWLEVLNQAKAAQANQLQFKKTQRDLIVESIESFGSVLTSWERRANEGSLKSHYDTRITATFDAGEPKFTPEANHTYFYENIGTNAKPAVLHEGYIPPLSNRVVVGDAQTKEVIASYLFPAELRNAVHTSVMSPDGKYAYIVGPRELGPDGIPDPAGAQTIIKVDAVTLQPVKQITVGGRLHHGQIFQEKYLLLDMFNRDPNGLAVMLYDPSTDTVVGGAKDIDLGGMVYTAWTDNEFIYALMEPAGYGPGRATGARAAANLYQGTLMALRPFWMAKIDPETWEVVKEYPLPGYRGTWGTIDSKKQFIYVTMSGSSNVTKINIETGAVVWTSATGPGPFGSTLTANEEEIWVASKGEGMGEFGRTITVLETGTGRILATLFAAYEMDHVLLSPNGKEIWATSNGEGRILVYDTATREQTHVIDMPEYGDAHGLIWVHYDSEGRSRVVRDQGGFHGGVNPVTGAVINY